jgi:hypothetical protein
MATTTIASAVIELVNECTSPDPDLLGAEVALPESTTTATTAAEPPPIGATALKAINQAAGADPPVVNVFSRSAIAVDCASTIASASRCVGHALGSSTCWTAVHTNLTEGEVVTP